jgi:uroporphyrinogen-III synthase
MRGARALLIPMLDFALPDNIDQLDCALRNFDRFDWWLLTSQNAVQFAFARAAAIGLDLGAATRKLQVAAVGENTAAAARECGVSVQVVATTHTGAALTQELRQHVKAKRVLLLRSDLADESLPGGLRGCGAEVTEAVAYCTVAAAGRQQLNRVDWEKVDAAVFFSPSALNYFQDTLGAANAHERCDRVLFAAAGPTTAAAVRKAGYPLLVQASDTSNGAVILALEEYWCGSRRAEQRGMVRL